MRARYLWPFGFLLGCHGDLDGRPAAPTKQPAPPGRATSIAPAASGVDREVEPNERTKEVTLDRFAINVPVDATLTTDPKSDDATTTATFERPGGFTLLVSIRKRDPGEYCARMLESDADVFKSAKVPGADRLERVRVGEYEGVLAVGRARPSSPNVKFLGHAQLEVCKPRELVADLKLVLADRDISDADRASLLGLAASLRRLPVADVPNDQCIENQVASACTTACDQGDAESCTKLGYLTYHGDGVAKDRNAALKLFERACKAGSEKGCRAIKLIKP